MFTRFAMIAVAVVTASVTRAGVIPLDPNSNESIRDQVMRIVQAPSAGPTTREALLAEVDTKLTAVANEVARLRALDEPAKERADNLERQLKEIRDRRDGQVAGKDNRPELHVVNVLAFEQRVDPGLTPAQRRRQFKLTRGPVVVEVQPTGRPIILAVCSYGRTKWEVHVEKDANVKKVLVGGYESQEITGVPDGIPVEMHTYEGTPRSPNYFCRFGNEMGDSSENGTVKLKTLTSLDISTLQVDRWYRGQPIVVGPGSDEWKCQRLLVELRPLYQEAAAYAIAQQRAAVRSVRFKAVRFPAPPVVPRPVPAAAGGNAPAANAVRMQLMMRAQQDAKPFLADFTPAGPIAETDVALPQRANHVAIDPNDSTIYAIDEQGVYRVDRKNGAASRLQIDDPDLPRISWCNGVTFDTKRRRVVVSAQNVLYAYDPVAGKWSGIVNLENLPATSFTYSAAQDCFYAVLPGMGGRAGVTRLMRYTAKGDPDQMIELSRSFASEMYRPDGGPQLIAVGNRLAMLSNPSRFDVIRARNTDASPFPRQKCYLIDPLTGEVTFAGAITTQSNAAVNLSEREMDDAWLALSGEDAAEVERAAARLTSGGEPTVAFLRSQLKRGSLVDPQKFSEYLAELDHDDFSHRDAASRELRRLGRSAEPMLREALAKNPSAEVKSRIETLLSELQPDAQGERKPDRETVAIGVLGRIGSPAAIDLLGELAAGAVDVPRTLDARRALQEFARDE